MSKHIRILHIARNIPVPGIKENDIILRICKDIINQTKFTFDIWFPKEVIFPLPFLKGRKKAISLLPKTFFSLGQKITSISYLRLPFVSFSYLIINSFQYLNRKEIAEGKNYNLIHAHTTMPDGFIGLKLKEKYKIPLILTMRNGDLDKISKLSNKSTLYKIYNLTLRKADKVIVHNYGTMKYVQSLNIVPVQIPHGIKTYVINKFAEKNTKRIITVSQLIRRKNIDWLIKAFVNIDYSDWELHIIGEGYKDTDLKKISKNRNNIFFHGRISNSETIEALKSSDIFVLPSDDETFGLAYLEAAANSCAIIGKRNTGIYGWLKDGVEAIFIEMLDELEISMKKLMDDKKYRISIASAGYNRVVKDFIWNKQIKKYIKEYLLIAK